MGERHIREPEWTDEDLLMVQALEEFENDLGPHGHPMSEATSLLADPARKDGTHRYVAEPVTDWAALAIEQARAHPSLEEDPLAKGYRFIARRVDRTTE